MGEERKQGEGRGREDRGGGWEEGIRKVGEERKEGKERGGDNGEEMWEIREGRERKNGGEG